MLYDMDLFKETLFNSEDMCFILSSGTPMGSRVDWGTTELIDKLKKLINRNLDPNTEFWYTFDF